MRKVIFLLAAILAAGTSHAQTNFSFLVDSKSEQVLPAGRYYWFHFENGMPVTTEIITRPLGGASPVVPPPPVTDYTAQVTALLAKVTADTDKKVTADKLAGLCDLLLAQVDAKNVKDVAALRKNIKAVVPVLMLMKKDTAWSPFTDGLIVLADAADFDACIRLLRATSAALKLV